jgi:hypothetical protein
MKRFAKRWLLIVLLGVLVAAVWRYVVTTRQPYLPYDAQEAEAK